LPSFTGADHACEPPKRVLLDGFDLGVGMLYGLAPDKECS
jgi:hypothetical protein